MSLVGEISPDESRFGLLPDRTAYIVRAPNGHALGHLLAGSDHSRFTLDMLQSLARAGHPALLETSQLPDATGAIMRIGVPRICRVRHVGPKAAIVRVIFAHSNCEHYLNSSRRDFVELYDDLTSARESNSYIAVGESLRFKQIFAVKAVGEEERPPLDTPVPEPQPTESELADRLEPITEPAARVQLDALQALSCSVRPSGQCIPFAYPDDGCDARAHVMCKLLWDKFNTRVAKVWAYGSGAVEKRATLSIDTSNHPDCRVSWLYHVAPVVRVSTTDGVSWRVLDPVLFAAALPTPEEWVARMGDPRAWTEFSDAAVSDRQMCDGTPTPSGWDPTFKTAEQSVETYRQHLKWRIFYCGPPPYCAGSGRSATTVEP